MVNPSADEVAEVALRLVDIWGHSVGQTTVAIPPLHRVSRFLKEFEGLLEDPAMQFNGVLRLESSRPIAVGGLLSLAPEGTLLDIPVGPRPGRF